MDGTCSYKEVPDTEELCGFLGQINCANLAGTLVGRRMPTHGLLSIRPDYPALDSGISLGIGTLKPTTPPCRACSSSNVISRNAYSSRGGRSPR